MDRWVGRVACVTGASVGIGEAICYKLLESGINVVGCARNKDKVRLHLMCVLHDSNTSKNN